MLGIWKRIQSLFRLNVVVGKLQPVLEEKQPAVEEGNPERNRLLQMQARSTLQGLQALQGVPASKVKSSSTGTFRRWSATEQPVSGAVSASGSVGAAGSAGSTGSIGPANLLAGTSLTGMPGISKRQSLQELLDIGCDHFSVE